MRKYDYIIAGAGCAGLSLAYHISRSLLRDKSILLIDKAPKTDNDRTWCFWEREENPFESIVCNKWAAVDFYGSDYHASLNLGKYYYKMIRGIDFYNFVSQTLSVYANIQFVYGNITDIQSTNDGAEVIVNDETYVADYLFNSIYPKDDQLKIKGNHYLLQHFKGWEIETQAETFNPQKATLMDFRIDQEEETRFFYVLPFDDKRALIEFTVFSETLLPAESYNNQVKSYIQKYLHITDYKIIHEEFGIIPMTDELFSINKGKYVINIGTTGGQTKASTGYTFLRIQQHTQALVRAMLKTGKPYLKYPVWNRFKLYDSLLLNIMARNRYGTKEIFTLLFQKNKASTILKFLDEQTSFAEELKIMSTTPYKPFLIALADVLLHKKQPFR